ncbi:hypothetical protein SDRG_01957 [Saprolegnia diclina VS20]|uniref:FYVE, RhoGEF and PH domain-containing protein 4 n=1 Tax=Saprolegnia diclina (strain VS20) TaxID=1156394 RepID=T0SD94_SAPDV|nr:hypothetical protein SDRG_01957 [Saprolegnia diclina VS20]EQC40892.1 hypothetical protein SDRG_01957 [Saprolegnia diclina VS20]|eukprot:XP_008605736.1 hypothetical protein SDRG_01957 [Saprolegnia diclina VS20]
MYRARPRRSVSFDGHDRSRFTDARFAPVFKERRPSARPEVDDDDDDDNNQHSHEAVADLHLQQTFLNDELVARDMKRQRVIEEICATEASYVSNLKVLVSAFVTPMEVAGNTMLANPTVAVFFQSLKQILTVNAQLLTEVGGLPSSADSIGALFCRYAPLFRCYADYAKNFDEVAQLLRPHRSPKFAAFVQQCQLQSGSMQNFESLLITPVQRVPRYKLLLERIAGLTGEGHPDHASLLQAVVAVGDAAQLINETVRQKENMEHVLRVQAQFVGQLSLFTLDRRLVCAGVLVKISTKRDEKVMLHLFNDLLLYSDILPAETYHCRRSVALASSACGIDATLPESYLPLFSVDRPHLQRDCGFKINSAEKSFVLFAASVDEKNRWVQLIADAIAGAQETGREAALENAAAVWIPDDAVESCSLCRRRFAVSFRRHHCRRCGNVVCGNCSTHRAYVIDNDPKEKRVCDGCFPVLAAVKRCAMRWLACLIEFRGVLRRLRKRRWVDCYFELKGGVLRQFALTGAPVIDGPQRNAPTDVLPMAGAILIRNIDSYGMANCFKITSRAEPDRRYKASPLKAYTKKMRKAPFEDDEWVLCASSTQDWAKWIDALDASAAKALQRTSSRARSIDLMSGSLLSLRDTQLDELELVRMDSSLIDDAKQERYRHHILKEIVRSEQSYVECLGECIRVFVQPLLLRQLEGRKLETAKQSLQRRLSQLSHSKLQKTFSRMGLTKRTQLRNGSSSLARGDAVKTHLDATMAVFFTSMDQIFTLNQQLLDHLVRHLAETDDAPVHRIGAIFNAYASLFQMYSSYASYHEAALAAIESDHFVSMLAGIQLHLDDGTLHRLRTYLNMPMERIPKYKVFLQELLACTDASHMDFGPLLSSIEKVDHVVQAIQDSIASRDAARKLREVQLQYGLPLPDSTYVKGGFLRKVCRGTVKTYHVVLLDHALLYAPTGLLATYQKKHKMIELTGASVSMLQDALPESVRQAVVVDGAPPVTHRNAFYFRSNQKSFMLIADSEDAQTSWVDAIHDAIAKVEMTYRLSNTSDEDDKSSPHPMDVFMRKPIKTGWLQVQLGKKKWRKQWVTVDYQHFTIGPSPQTSPETTLVIASCAAVSVAAIATQFEIRGEPVITSLTEAAATFTFVLDAGLDRDEWLRALTHCIRSSAYEDATTCLSAVSEPALHHFAPVFQFHNTSKKCMLCGSSFTLYRLRHHCKNCGTLVCGSCSKARMVLSHDLHRAVRVCDHCVDEHTSDF